MIEVTLPDSSWEDVEEGTEALVERWLVDEGAQVKIGQPIVQVVVVKASHEIVAPTAGVVARILVPAESTFARGTPLALLRAEKAS